MIFCQIFSPSVFFFFFFFFKISNQVLVGKFFTDRYNNTKGYILGFNFRPKGIKITERKLKSNFKTY